LQVTDAHLSWLAGLLEEAIAAEEFERARYLRDLRDVITPRATALTADDFTPEGLEAQAQCFFDNGFVIVRNALPRIAQIQAAWDQLEPPARKTWERCRRHGGGIARHSFGSSEDDAWRVHICLQPASCCL